MYIPLIKELRLPTKASALWALADLPELSKESLKALDQIIEFRNAFVHYKWLASGENATTQRRAKLREVVENSEQLVTALFAAESAAFWNGRDEELINRLHESVEQRWREKPFKLNSYVDSSED